MRRRFTNAIIMLTVFAWFTIVAGQIPASDEPSKTSDATSRLKLVPSKEVNGDEVKLRGRVLCPDGNPASAARISVVRSAYVTNVGAWRRLATATTKPDGAFEALYRKSQYGKKPNGGRSVGRDHDPCRGGGLRSRFERHEANRRRRAACLQAHARFAPPRPA